MQYALKDVYMYNDLIHGLMFVVGTEDMSKARFIFMCLCPNLILGIIPYILFLIFPQLVGVGLFGIICIGTGFGDYLNIYNSIRQMPKIPKHIYVECILIGICRNMQLPAYRTYYT